MTAPLAPIEVCIGHDGVQFDVQLLGEPTGNPDLAVVPYISGHRELDDWGDPTGFDGWTVYHRPTRAPVVTVNFTLDDARLFAGRIAHLDWAHLTREDTRAGRHPEHHFVVKQALEEVRWW